MDKTLSLSKYNNKEEDKRGQEEQIRRAKIRREALLKKIRKEKRVMLVCSFFAAIAALLWLVGSSLDYWYYVTTTSNSTAVVESFSTSYSGLWRSCRTFINSSSSAVSTERTECTGHDLFPSLTELKLLDVHMLDYYRTSILFALLSLLLMLMSLTSAFYTFKNSRYIYKRLAAGLYFISGFSVLIVLEVVVTYVRYEKLNVPFNQPIGSSVSYGACFYVGWIVFLTYLLNGCIFLVYSRKRKQAEELDDDYEQDGIF